MFKYTNSYLFFIPDDGKVMKRVNGKYTERERERFLFHNEIVENWVYGKNTQLLNI